MQIGTYAVMDGAHYAASADSPSITIFSDSRLADQLPWRELWNGERVCD